MRAKHFFQYDDASSDDDKMKKKVGELGLLRDRLVDISSLFYSSLPAPLSLPYVLIWGSCSPASLTLFLSCALSDSHRKPNNNA